MSYDNPFLEVKYAVDQQRTLFTFSLAQLCAYRTIPTQDGYYVCMQSLFDVCLSALHKRLNNRANTSDPLSASAFFRD